ncbi:MAG: 40S ribosomal protein S17 [Nitrosopumilus sp.]|nr:40S ribosomal protein S17 [Nitrosopumilus sp.]
MDRIKRLSYEVLDAHKSSFGEDFVDNKKVLDQISIIRSKGLKNEVAGYITKFIKKEIREEKAKQARIESSRSEEQETSVDIIEETTTSKENTAVVEETTTSKENTAVVEETTTSKENTAVVEETTTPEEKTE